MCIRDRGHIDQQQGESFLLRTTAGEHLAGSNLQVRRGQESTKLSVSVAYTEFFSSCSRMVLGAATPDGPSELPPELSIPGDTAEIKELVNTSQVRQGI